MSDPSTTEYFNTVPYAYSSWDECLERNAEKRKQWSIEEDIEQDKIMCRQLFRLYFSDVTRIPLEKK